MQGEREPDLRADLEAAETLNRQLVDALSSRTVLGQATGIVMERYQIDADAAFARLVKVSSERNRKVRDIAHQIVTTGRAEGL